MDAQNIPDLDNIDQDQAREMLQKFVDDGFDGVPGMAALALGREEDSIVSMLDGTEDIDEDMIMKMLGIAQEREIDIGQSEMNLAAAAD